MNIRTISIKRMLVAGVTLVAALAVGLTAVGAQDTTPPDRPGRGGMGMGMGMFGDGGRFGGRDGQRGMGLMAEWGQIVADATGLELTEIAQQMRDGSTLATIITDNGGDVEAVIASIVSSATESINTAVTEGTITQERADVILTNLEAHVTAFVNGEGPGIGGRIANTVRAGLRLRLVREVAEATGLEVSAVREQLLAGSTLAEILTANGVDVDAFVTEKSGDFSAQLTEALNTQIPQADAEAGA